MLIGSGIRIHVTYEADNDKDVYDGGRPLGLLYDVTNGCFIGCTSLAT